MSAVTETSIEYLSNKSEGSFLQEAEAEKGRKVHAVASRWLDDAYHRAEERASGQIVENGDSSVSRAIVHLAVERGILRAMVTVLIEKCIDRGIDV
jgi:hypothetical protein